jgi:hypothetical protein
METITQEKIVKSDNNIYLMHYELTLIFGTCFVMYCECNRFRKDNHWFWQWCRKLTTYSVFMESQLLLSLTFSGFNTELTDIVINKVARNLIFIFKY